MRYYDDEDPFHESFPPPDLARYWKEVHPDLPGQGIKAQTPPDGHGFVCPACKCIFRSDLGGMLGSFKTHVREYEETGGCTLSPPRKGMKRKGEF